MIETIFSPYSIVSEKVVTKGMCVVGETITGEDTIFGGIRSGGCSVTKGVSVDAHDYLPNQVIVI